MESKIELELIGITFNQIESGVYALVLQQKGGTCRIPIVIGYPEAQAIECKLQHIVTPRPLTHDLMVNLMSTFNLSLTEVNIKRLPNGIFGADMVFTDGINTHILDARSSDAISMAIRVDAPIYTTQTVLDEAGFNPSDNEPPLRQSSRSRDSHVNTQPPANHKQSASVKKQDNSRNLSDIDPLELIEMMEKAAEREDYEEAARIKAELNRRNNHQL